MRRAFSVSEPAPRGVVPEVKRVAKQTIAELEKLGFDYLWRNSSGDYVYVHPDDPAQTEVKVSPSLHEHAAKGILARCRRIAGLGPVIVKRRAENVKERAQAERDRAEQRLAWALQKQARLESDRADQAWLERIRELVEHRRAELAALHRGMTGSPQGGAHVGRGRVDVLAPNPF